MMEPHKANVINFLKKERPGETAKERARRETALFNARDLAEVVRCGECIHYQTEQCAWSNGPYDTEYDQYCSAGERKEE